MVADGVRLPQALSERIEALPPVHPVVVLQWLDMLHGERHGWLEIGARTADQLEFESLWFRWPDQRLAAMHTAAVLARDHDVWAGCLLKTEQRRGTELAGRWAWCDNDAKRSLIGANEAVAELSACTVASGTPGNRQVWVHLTGDATPAELRQICKGLIARIGGDAKHSPDSIMRIPGTLNHKPCEDDTHRCRPVTWVQRAVRQHAKGDLIFTVKSTEPEPGLPEPGHIARRGPAWTRLRKAMETQHADPSEHTQFVAHVAAELFSDDTMVLEALNIDQVTQTRRAEKKRDQPGWWPSEFARVLAVARADHPSEEAGSSQAAVLMAMANSLYEIVMATDGEAVAAPLTGPRVVRPLRHDKHSLRSELSSLYHNKHGSPPSNSALADVMTALEGQAVRGGLEIATPLRVARWEDSLVLDLGDATGRAVVIRPGHWEVVEQSPVPFRRTRATAPLPVPVGGSKLTEVLFPLLNIPRGDWSLMAAVLVSTLWPDIPHPIPFLTGSEGTAKTSATRLLRSLVDPSEATTQGMPPEKDWDVMISAQWVVALDNLSSIPEWMSDALCRAVTGEGTIKRKLYTDADISLIAARRVVMINGISPVIGNADLAGRTITFELEPIQGYRGENGLALSWAEAHPLALGALLDQAAAVMAKMPSVEFDPVFRMADFAHITATMDQINGTSALEAYRQRLAHAAEDIIRGDVVASVLLDWGNSLREPWEGSLQALSELLVARLGHRPAGWPRSPNAWVVRLSRVGNVLGRAGIVVRKGDRTNRSRQWVVTRRDLGG